MEPAAKRTPQTPHKTFAVPLWVLICIQIFNVWQMGVVYYSSRTFTINGVTPLPISVDSAALPIALGYLAGAGLCFWLSHRVGLLAKVLTALSLVCIMLMYAPLPNTVLAALYYAQAFLCVIFIGIITILTINLYSIKTALLDGLAATMAASPLIAVLHFSTFTLSFRTFNLISAVIQVLVLLGLTRIPNRVDIRFLPKQSARPAAEKHFPPPLLYRPILIYTVVCLCLLSSSTIAESLPGGISLLYLSGFGWAVVFAFLHYRYKHSPFLLHTIFLGIGAFGFILWLFPLAALRPASILLQGTFVVLGNLAWFPLSLLFEKWNSRTIAPIAMLIALFVALIHSLLLDLLREAPELLYAIYAVVALGLLLLYLITEPYLRRVWIDVAAKEVSLGAPAAKLTMQTKNATQAPGTAEEKRFTKREHEILRLLIQGYDNGSIAKILFISEHTVKSHVKNIFRKMDVHSRFELASKINRQDEGAVTKLK